MNRWYKQGNALIKEIRETLLPENMLAVWFMGQAAIVIKSGTLTIAVDLYLENRPGRVVPPPFEAASCAGLFDYVFCTHNHADHLDRVVISGIAQAEVGNPKTRFVVPAPWTGILPEMGVDESMVIGASHQTQIRLACQSTRSYQTMQNTQSYQTMQNTQSYQTASNTQSYSTAPNGQDCQTGLDGQAFVIPVRAAHETFSTDVNGDYECLGYIIRLPGGTVYHSGDTIEWESMTDELGRYPVDIACLPINGSDWKRKKADIIGNLNAREAADVSDAISADLLIPLHYDVFAHNGENPAYLADYMWHTYPAGKYHIMAPGERLIYMK